VCAVEQVHVSVCSSSLEIPLASFARFFRKVKTEGAGKEKFHKLDGITDGPLSDEHSTRFH
jgi:hypothetical protein